MLERESGSARKLYAGNDWMKLALQDGRFPNGTPIPGLGAWATMPSKLTFAAAHHHHWHISLHP
jgi:hypothetical protein